MRFPLAGLLMMRPVAVWLALLLSANLAIRPSAQTPTATARMSANDL